MVSIFMPQLIEAQKEYAAVLTRKNAYRQMTYSRLRRGNYGITNENSLFMWSADHAADAAGVYAGSCAFV